MTNSDNIFQHIESHLINGRNNIGYISTMDLIVSEPIMVGVSLVAKSRSGSAYFVSSFINLVCRVFKDYVGHVGNSLENGFLVGDLVETVSTVV